MAKAKDDSRGSALELLEDAVADIRANADEKQGMTQQQERACQLIEKARRMLVGTQTRSKPTRVQEG